MLIVVPAAAADPDLLHVRQRRARVFDRIALIMLGIFPFVIMFLVTSIAMLRERTTGTLERLLTTPLGKLDLLFGYGIAFGVAAAVQGVVAAGVAYWLFGLDTAGDAWLVVLIAVANAVLGVALGLFCSAFARTEFQAVQFMPVVVVPQILLCGLFVAARTDGRLAAGDQRRAAAVVRRRGADTGRRASPSRPAPCGGTSASSPGRRSSRSCWHPAGAAPDHASGSRTETSAGATERARDGARGPKAGLKGMATSGDGAGPATRQSGHPRRDPRRGPDGVRRARVRRCLDPGDRHRRRGRSGAGTPLFRHQGAALPRHRRRADRPGELLPQVLAGRQGRVGERLVADVPPVWDSPAGSAGAALLRSAMSSEWTARLLREFLVTQILRRILKLLDRQPGGRAAAHLAGRLSAAGPAMTRYILKMEPLASAPRRR